MSIHIAVVTTGRADYGLLHPLLTLLAKDSRFELSLIVTGSHLVADQGLTVNEIARDGFDVFRSVALPEGEDSRLATARAVGEGVSLLASAIDESRADIVVVLGDRFEAFAAASASAILGVPVAHIDGGELTLGSLDDAFRHAITKLSTLHFTSADEYRRRVIQMGEPPFTVFNVGALAVDNVRTAELLDEAAFESTYGMTCDSSTLLVTFHPVTRGGDSLAELRDLLNALDLLPDFRVLFTAPNVDAGGRSVRAALDEWVSDHSDRAKLVPSLGWLGYLSAARNSAAVVGNSSSGVIEVPALGVPSVDIGTRQQGRIHPASVVHADSDVASIVRAVERATAPEHRERAAGAFNPYGDGHAAEKIVEALADAELLDRARNAHFVDLDFEEPQ